MTEVQYTGSVIKSYSLTGEHIAKVSQLADELKLYQGEVVRQAIDLLWKHYHPDDEVEMGDEALG